MSAQITAVPFAERERHHVRCDECEWSSHSLSPYSNGYPHELSKIENEHNAWFHDPENPPRFVPGGMYAFTLTEGDTDYAFAELDENGAQVLVLYGGDHDKRILTTPETETAVPA